MAIITSPQIENEIEQKKDETDIVDLTICYYCKSTGLNEEDKFCPNCRFPQNGTQREMKRFLVNVANKKQLLIDKKKSVKKARIILFILAGLNFVFGIVFGIVLNFNIQILIGSILGALIYFGLGMWSRKNPFPAILSGFLIYVVFNVITAIANPATIVQGIIWKVLIISGFVYGYKGVKDSEALEVELASIKEAKDLSPTHEV